MKRLIVLLVAVVLALSAAPLPAVAQPDQVTLTVSVVDRGGSAVSSATLTASWADGERTVTTASNGKALIDVDRGADVTLDVTHPDYVRNTPIEVANATEEDVELTVAEKGGATVTALDPSGQPVPNARVQLWQTDTYVVNERANADGVLQTGTIEQGEYTLRVAKPGYFENRSEIAVGEDSRETVTIEPGTVTASFNVTDDHFGPVSPVQNATIAVAGQTLETHFDGRTEVPLSVNDRYDVTITKDGYEQITRELRVVESPVTLSATIHRTPGITITPLSDRVVVNEMVRVSVRNEYEEAVPNATITLDGETVGETNQRGNLTFAINSSGDHTVAAESGEHSATATISGIAEGETGTDTDTATPETTTSEGIGPGFGPVAALTALVALVLVGRRRR